MKQTKSEPKTVRISAIVEASLAEEIDRYVNVLSVNKSALVRRGLRLALNEMKAKHNRKPVPI